jgi:hypothetical protein
VSSPDSEDFGNDLLAAKDRDLKPLLEESEEILDLDLRQTEAMEDFLTLAWFSGIRSGQAQMKARATEDEPDIRAVAISHFEADFKELMERSAEVLNLSLPGTISMWGLLHQAWLAGNRTCKAELMGLYLETQADVTEEARRWLDGEGEDEPEYD